MVNIHDPKFQSIIENILNNTVIPDNTMPSFDEASFNFNREMNLIDQRYQAENHLLKAIASGNFDLAIAAFQNYGELMKSPLQKIYPSSCDSFRDFKNSIHTMNTLFRKAVEENQVHPIYIHEYSSRFAYTIEKAETMDELLSIIFEMVKKYCYLVKNYSLAKYSGTVKKAILYIQINLCGPLSTIDIAKKQNISPNYLSNQFKAEVGCTITDYIRSHRIDRALKLLSTTELSIQDIASQIGIEDASYFSKQFKKEIGMSPLQYQKMIRKKTVH